MPFDDQPNTAGLTVGEMPETSTTKGDEEIPACQFCRKKKAKCNRAQPCSQCVRSEVSCVYDDRRLKPGLRAGAVDQLYQRIETLENMFLGQEMLWKQMWQALFPNTQAPQITNDQNTGTGIAPTLVQRREQLKESLLQSAASQRSVSNIDAVKHLDSSHPPPAKRIRVKDTKVDGPRLTSPSHISEISTVPDSVLNELVDFYFVNIHPWIPILHVTRFRERMRSPDARIHISCILNAIIAVCVRFSQNESYRSSVDLEAIAQQSRREVILQSTESFSVENVQALVIVAFETINRGRGPSSWSIIGSIVATIEQLQLSVEEDTLYNIKNTGEMLIRRMIFLAPSRSWSEAEERRRVFWAVFLMDRFCSFSTGWKIGLPNSEVQRRLPCEGALWEKEQEVCAPYLGIPNLSTSESNNNIDSARTPSSLSRNGYDENAIGGFAYNIEATESLALVTHFYLHHAFLVTDNTKAQLWLVKFKELDLRLIQWKMYLPPQWREASVLNLDGVMDPNLTLAHITHNTAVILLHQVIAYPPAHWRGCSIRLPSTSSAETCLEAAAETATIGQQFLMFSPIFTNPQFSFCLFVAGRMLLTHAKYNRVAPSPALDSLITSLMEISQRWTRQGNVAGSDHQDSLAFKFATRLIEAQQNRTGALSRPSLDIRSTVYSDESKEQPSPSGPLESPHYPEVPEGQPSQPHSGSSCVFDPFSLAFPPLPLAFQQDFLPDGVDPIAFYSHPSQQSDSGSPSLHILNSQSQHLNSGVPTEPTQLFDFQSTPGQRISYYGSQARLAD